MVNIPDFLKKIKSGRQAEAGEVSFDAGGRPVRSELLRGLFLPLAVVLVGFLGFGLGRLSGAGERPPVKIEYDPNIISNSQFPVSKIENSGEVYASSKGSKYYYSACKNTISAANKVTFASAAMAESAGYTLASTCHK